MDTAHGRKVEPLHTVVQSNQPPTPSLARRKKIQETIDFRSPTDNMVSPCSRKLNRKTAKDIHTTPHMPKPKHRSVDKENMPQK